MADITNSANQERSMPDFSDPRKWKLLSACPLCGASHLSLKVTARDRHYGNPGTFKVMECGECGVYFLNPMPTPDYLSSAYPDNYYAHALKASEAPQGLIRRVKKILRTVLFNRKTKDPEFSSPGRVLDVGSGYGVFLSQMKRDGWEVYGVEPDCEAAARGRQEGLNIFGGFIEQAQFPSDYFDYVRSNHSFEHVHNPRELLREMRRVIKPTGYLFIGVPNVRGLAARIFGTYWWYLGAPVHTFGYCPRTLRALLESEGFSVESVKYNSEYAGIFGSLQIYLNRNNGRMSNDGRVIHSRVLMVAGHWAGRLLDLLRAGDCIEVIARRR
ncbi:class I SAM-dependent methyltransferase [Occallatibacter riparius]|uniref:Class I SAM-dependent methyltransferase n=1 Tax=Occallatibacter riparius TaxID=1002689 RepID=A0A9J7BR42_9BACT|nr:class I SAM-dependent methyltransferase [Occallatibacter riparius]UWZ85291.1 class I SAM-dependent methyltransferase [Occallatibacter riparius]